ncbi:aspartyl-phosphate phosphatase Spo0E family protein [Virgibacillus pantothenticus]|nr:aspartyl-phosphate phosphatase Spo0E family protein [Virgibacillus pantothenticus]
MKIHFIIKLWVFHRLFVLFIKQTFKDKSIIISPPKSLDQGGNSLAIMKTTDDLLKRIEYLRQRMTEVALEKGFTNLEAIELSQELDQLLNLYETQKRHRSKKTKY